VTPPLPPQRVQNKLSSEVSFEKTVGPLGPVCLRTRLASTHYVPVTIANLKSMNYVTTVVQSADSLFIPIFRSVRAIGIAFFKELFEGRGWSRPIPTLWEIGIDSAMHVVDNAPVLTHVIRLRIRLAILLVVTQWLHVYFRAFVNHDLVEIPTCFHRSYSLERPQTWDVVVLGTQFHLKWVIMLVRRLLGT